MELVSIINLSSGLLFMLLGPLVKRYPNLIAGYNTMSSEEKEKFDIDGYSTYMRNALVLIGTLVLLSSFAFAFVFSDRESPLLEIGIFVLITLSGCMHLLSKAQSYYKR